MVPTKGGGHWIDLKVQDVLATLMAELKSSAMPRNIEDLANQLQELLDAREGSGDGKERK